MFGHLLQLAVALGQFLCPLGHLLLQPDPLFAVGTCLPAVEEESGCAEEGCQQQVEPGCFVEIGRYVHLYLGSLLHPLSRLVGGTGLQSVASCRYEVVVRSGISWSRLVPFLLVSLQSVGETHPAAVGILQGGQPHCKAAVPFVQTDACGRGCDDARRGQRGKLYGLRLVMSPGCVGIEEQQSLVGGQPQCLSAG